LHHLVRQRVTGDATLQLGTLLAAQHDQNPLVLALPTRFDVANTVPSPITDRTSGRLY
jgi:hypothetical protein